MAVTIKDVAREAGVSIGLVSMVVNGKTGVNRKTADKVRAVIKRLGYKPNKAAASLRSGRKLTIGVITPDLASRYFSEISRNIENIAYKAGYTVLFGSSDDNVTKTDELIDIFAANDVGGVLITPCDNCEGPMKKALDNGMPVVLMNRDLPSLKGVGRVRLDNRRAIEMALNHLFTSGRRHIEMLSNSVILSTLNRREQYYLDVMKEHGLERFAHINYIRENASLEEYTATVANASSRGAEALLIPRGHLALNAFKAINALGLRIPEDIALLGFDGGESYTLTNPEITQVDQLTHETAVEAFTMLRELMDGGKPRTVLLDPVLKIGGSTASLKVSVSGNELLIPGSLFENRGGWTLDQQFMDQCGSSVLLAHGLGTAVEDASTGFEINRDGSYHIWARTRNWTAPWSDKATPGTFGIRIDDMSCDTIFGTGSAEWHWQDGGTMMLRRGSHMLTVHDFKGFDARFDSIFLALENENGEARSPYGDMTAMRREFLGLPETAKDAGTFDLVVAGGGVAGICAAIAAARSGLKVALVQDRMVLGGNNSSEVRVGLGGRLNIGRYPSLGYLLNEFGPSRKGNARTADTYEDGRKLDAVLAEKNITLMLGLRVTGVEKDGDSISAVILTDIENYRTLRLRGRLFADCTGDASLGVLAGADWHMGREARSEYGEPSAPETPDGITLGASMQWYSEEEDAECSFPDIDWGLDIDERSVQKVRRGQWYWEVGMAADMIQDAERIRDYGMYVAYSNWSYIKNHASFREEYAKSSLKWLCSVAGKRESRRLMGDHVLTENDLTMFNGYIDGCVSTSWYIDNHEADPVNAAMFKEPWLSRGVLRPLGFYPIPYRCLYSRNVNNLFMAGRNISVSHIALGTVRVMRTCAMMGEVVGLAAGICTRRSALPRDVYEKWWQELDALMRKGAGRTDVPYQQVYTLVDTTGARNEDC